MCGPHVFCCMLRHHQRGRFYEIIGAIIRNQKQNCINAYNICNNAYNKIAIVSLRSCSLFSMSNLKGKVVVCLCLLLILEIQACTIRINSLGHEDEFWIMKMIVECEYAFGLLLDCHADVEAWSA